MVGCVKVTLKKMCMWEILLEPSRKIDSPKEENQMTEQQCVIMITMCNVMLTRSNISPGFERTDMRFSEGVKWKLRAER